MNMDAMIQSVADWAFADPSGVALAVGALALLGALNGIRLSLSRCGRAARRRR
jgi:hypothetical protein